MGRVVLWVTDSSSFLFQNEGFCCCSFLPRCRLWHSPSHGSSIGLCRCTSVCCGSLCSPCPIDCCCCRTSSCTSCSCLWRSIDYAGQVYPLAEPYVHEEIPAEEYAHQEIAAEAYVHEDVAAEAYVHEEIPAEEYVHSEIAAEPYVHSEIAAEPYVHAEIAAEPYVHQEPVAV